MDAETKTILDSQQQVAAFVKSEGWGSVREKLTNKIIDLQNAFNIEDKDAEKMLIDLRARKMATEMLFGWLQEIEGTNDQYNANKLTLNSKPYMVREDLT